MPVLVTMPFSGLCSATVSSIAFCSNLTSSEATQMIMMWIILGLVRSPQDKLIMDYDLNCTTLCTNHCIQNCFGGLIFKISSILKEILLSFITSSLRLLVYCDITSVDISYGMNFMSSLVLSLSLRFHSVIFHSGMKNALVAQFFTFNNYSG